MRRRPDALVRVAAATIAGALALVVQLSDPATEARAQQPPPEPPGEPPAEPPPGEPPERPAPGEEPEPGAELPDMSVKPPPGAAPAQPAPGERVEVLLDPADTIVLLLDHQTGLLQTVKDIPVQDLRANAVVLAKVAGLAGAPVITTASEPQGPNGPLIPELAEAAPDATFVARKGEVSAWDNDDFRRAVEATGRRTLVMAGVWTSVCVAFPALQAMADGYEVYVVTDASGDLSEMASETTLHRMTQAGAVPVTTNVVMAELQRTWARPDAAAWGALYSELVPHYRAVSESYQKARQPRGPSQGPQGRR